MSKPAVFGIVESETQARSALTELEAAGFQLADISVLSRNGERGNLENVTGEEAYSGASNAAEAYTVGGTGIGIYGTGKNSEVGHTNATKAPEGTTAGVVSGGVLGGIAGWLVGIGALAIPGVGPFIAAGPILAALSGAAIVAAAGGVVGALVGAGIPEHEAKLYAGRLESGHILIGVHTENSTEAKSAEEVLRKVKAHAIKTTSELAAK